LTEIACSHHQNTFAVSWGRRSARSRQVIIDRLAGLVGQLKADRSTGFLLANSRALKGTTVW
jgi:hypothetical protein